jgi:tetratricopeptide (TPR) repeat protein
MLQNTAILAREVELATDVRRQADLTAYLLEVLPALAEQPGGDLVLRRRAADQLALTCESALAAGVLGEDPHAAADRFGRLLELVRRVNPTSEHLYTSQIKLAIFTRDRLREPQVAARRLERLLLNLDLPTEGVALVRLTMGECYLAAGDTSRARTVLDNLGRDPRFRREGGHAHYHLARLDLAQGHFATARDRFAVVALDNPAAPYANDSLEMGLAVAEEMDNPSGGPEILALYGRSVYADMVGDPAGRRRALEEFVAAAAARLDMNEPQHLLERVRFELAMVYEEEGRTDEALDLLARIVADHPDGRQAPRALEASGRIRAAAGDAAQARNAWERLLAQYPDYLFIDDVRDALRTLP